jgi:hypothetical protein
MELKFILGQRIGQVNPSPLSSHAELPPLPPRAFGTSPSQQAFVLICLRLSPNMTNRNWHDLNALIEDTAPVLVHTYEH